LHDGRPNLPQLLPLHTHNAPVQVWLELGIFGALALAWLIAMLSWKGYAMARDRAGMAATAGLSAAFFVVAVVSFGAWQSWWWAAMLLALGVTGAALQSSGGKPSADAR
jgi:O-antigen ligase